MKDALDKYLELGRQATVLARDLRKLGLAQTKTRQRLLLGLSDDYADLARLLKRIDRAERRLGWRG